MNILGIESSCDETGVALVEVHGQALPRLRAHALHSQVEMHQAYGLTSIIATHNPRLANACDRVLRLEGGRLIPA